MFSKKKIECRVCGYRFTLERENIYTAEEPRSVVDTLTKAPTRFSAVDCPVCGCQIALAIRAPRIDLSDITEQHKECSHCGAHLDSGEKCDCRAAEADGNAEKELKESAKGNDRN